jgi:hypothetical protein
MIKFIYCENTEGGMESTEYSFNLHEDIEFNNLYGWMRHNCSEADIALVDWAISSKIGEFFKHRLGMCFRVKPDLVECTACSGYRYYKGRPCGDCKGTGFEEK